MPGPSNDSAALSTGLALVDCSPDLLWIRYFGIGGSLSEGEFVRSVISGTPLLPDDFDLAVLALNEMAEDAGLGRPVRRADERGD